MTRVSAPLDARWRDVRATLAADWRDRVDAVVLAEPAASDDVALRDVPATLLVRPESVGAARATLEAMPWRFVLGDLGMWRARRGVVYVFDDGPVVKLLDGVPAGPFPCRSLRRLERRLWSSASPADDGLATPDLDVLLVYLAVQSCLPQPVFHRAHWQQFRFRARDVEDWAAVRAEATLSGVRTALERALAAHLAGAAHPPTGPVFDNPVLRHAFRAAEAARRRARPRGLRSVLGGNIDLGVASCRARFESLELRSAPPAYPPMPFSAPLVEAADERVAGVDAPVLVDVGTGCGAFALALARRHPAAEIYATDTSAAALRWAARNRRRLGAGRVHLARGSLLDPVPVLLRGRVDAIVGNLPYYPAAGYVPAGSVPRDAIQGTDDDGLGLYRTLADEARGYLAPGGRLVMQMFQWQWDRFASELRERGYAPGSAVHRGPFAIAWADRTDPPSSDDAVAPPHSVRAVTGRRINRENAALLLRIWRVFVLVHLGLRRTALPELVASFGQAGPATSRRHSPAKLGRAVNRALTLRGKRPRCLIRALVLFRLLSEQGQAVELVIGLPDPPTNHEAHAWIEVDGVDLGPPPGRGQHTALARYH